MKHLPISILAAGLLFVGTQSFADDMQKDHMSDHRTKMKDCMTREKAKNVGWTHDQVKAACMSQAKGNTVEDTNQAMKPAEKTPEKTP